jgi:hypothetical protein
MKSDMDVFQVACAYYDRTVELCRAFTSFEVEIEKSSEWWSLFCTLIGAEVNVEASLSEFSRAYNSRVARGKDNYIDI